MREERPRGGRKTEEWVNNITSWRGVRNRHEQRTIYREEEKRLPMWVQKFRMRVRIDCCGLLRRKWENYYY